MLTRHLPLKAICPKTGDLKPVAVPMMGKNSVIARIQDGDAGLHKRWELTGGEKGDLTLSCVVCVLESPRAIFGGVREHQEGGYCYCGKPPNSWTNKAVCCPPPPGKIFVVYVNPQDVVYEWRWEGCDPKENSLPVDWFRSKRFSEGMIWPTKQPSIC